MVPATGAAAGQGEGHGARLLKASPRALKEQGEIRGFATIQHRKKISFFFPSSLSFSAWMKKKLSLATHPHLHPRFCSDWLIFLYPASQENKLVSYFR